MNRWYLTCYPARPTHAKIGPIRDDDAEIEVGDYSSDIYANSERHARLLAKRRNIGEKVIGIGRRGRKPPYPLPSELLSKPRLTPRQKLDAIHATTFLCYLLMQSCSAPPCDILGDLGLLHQVIHALSFGSPRRKDIVGALRHFEALVPGYLPISTR